MAETMVRKQLYIERSQDQLLKRLARERGTTEAELVREALDKYTSEPEQRRREIWAREVAFMRERAAAAKGTAQRSRDWTREELYEDRMKRYERHSG